MEAKVYVPQVTMRFEPNEPLVRGVTLERNNGTGRMVPAYNFESVKEYGEITTILEADQNPFVSGVVVPKLKAALANFDPANDYLLATGEPIIIGLCIGIIMEKSDSFKALKWNRKWKKYTIMRIEL